MTAALQLLACASRARVVLTPQDRARRDSLNVALRAGARDARVLHHDRSVVRPLLLASLPAGALAAAATKRDGAWPAVTLGISLTAAVSAFHTKRQPVPLPPDSMRTKYHFDSDDLWNAYRRGYQSDIQRRRDGEFLASQIWFEGLGGIFLFAAAFRRAVL